MSQLDEFAGSALRDALDASSQARRQGAVRRTEESINEQAKRLEAAAKRAADVAQDALNVHEKLLENSEKRVAQAARDAEERSVAQALLQQETATKLEQYALEREVGAVERALRRAEERALNATRTREILEEAAAQRGKVRENLEGFRAQLYRSSTGVARLELPEKTVAAIVRPRVVPRTAPRKTLALLPQPVVNNKVGAMQNPDPMTAIARRRENVLIKMIAANPGMLLTDLEKNLYMDAAELHGILKRLVASGRITFTDGAYHIANKSRS